MTTPFSRKMVAASRKQHAAFGVTVTHRTSADVETSCTALVENLGGEEESFDDGLMVAHRIRVRILLDDVAAPTEDDEVEHKGNTFHVNRAPELVESVGHWCECVRYVDKETWSRRERADR